MAPRSKEEREARRQAAKERAEARKKAKEQKASTTKDSSSSSKVTASSQNTTNTKTDSNETSPLLTLPEDSLCHVLCYLPSRELGATISTCSTLNYSLSEFRVTHLLSRLNRKEIGVAIVAGDLKTHMNICTTEKEVEKLVEQSYGGGDTKRCVVNKKRKGKEGDCDEYVAYVRFLEEGICGYAAQTFGGKTTPLLPPIVNGRYISTSPEHTLCRLGGDGSKSGAGGSGVASWGVGKRGQLGQGKRKDEEKPFRLLGGIGYGIRIVQVSAGGGLVRVAHSLLLTSTGRVLSFGTAQYGQLGHGYSSGKQLSDELRPRYIDQLSHVRCTCVSAGELHSAAVTTDGDLYTWGDGFCGQLGLGDKRPQLTPVQVTDGGLEDEVVLSVACGSRHTLCVSEDGEVFSCGLGHFGVLGRTFTPFEYDTDAAIVEMGEGGEEMLPPPMAMAPAMNETAIVPPSEESNSGGAEEGGRGQIDAGLAAHLDLIANITLDDSSDQCIFKVIDALEGVVIIGASAGHRHSMVLDNKGGLYTFGSGAAGALGHGDTLRQEFPMKVMEFVHTNTSIMQMSAGVDMSMAVSTSGDVYAWGKSEGGRIGLGASAGNVSIPRRVYLKPSCDAEVKALDVECGYMHSAIVGLDGTVHMCGGVGIDGADDGQRLEYSLDETAAGKPVPLEDFNIWHRLPEPKAVVTKERWKKYGKYELKGRRAMMEETSKWGA